MKLADDSTRLGITSTSLETPGQLFCETDYIFLSLLKVEIQIFHAVLLWELAQDAASCVSLVATQRSLQRSFWQCRHGG